MLIICTSMAKYSNSIKTAEKRNKNKKIKDYDKKKQKDKELLRNIKRN